MKSQNPNVDAYVAALKGALLAQADPRLWFKGLPPQQSSLLGLLLAAYPKAVSTLDLLKGLPCTARFASPLDRKPLLVAVQVNGIRRTLGDGAVETVWGYGYRLSASLHAKLATAPSASPG